MNYFVMTRTGVFKPASTTPNQCKVEGHPSYHYELKIVFAQRVSLDKDRFIIDHADLHEVIYKAKLKGSCEDMQLDICGIMSKFLASKNLPYMGFKFTIKPSENPAAWLDSIVFSDILSVGKEAIIATLLK